MARRPSPLGPDIHEDNPPDAQQRLLLRKPVNGGPAPVFAQHAKTMVVDSKRVYIGTFNLDPHPENLNTEVAAVIHHPGLARSV